MPRRPYILHAAYRAQQEWGGGGGSTRGTLVCSPLCIYHRHFNTDRGSLPQVRSLEPCDSCCFWQEPSPRVFEHPRTHFVQAPLLYTLHARPTAETANEIARPRGENTGAHTFVLAPDKFLSTKKLFTRETDGFPAGYTCSTPAQHRWGA